MIRIFILTALTLCIGACGGSGSRYANAPVAPTYRSGSLTPPKAQSSARGLKPYVIRGVKYYPRDDIAYRQRGYASWYGPKFHGRLTANGERFNQYALTAAHKTLPLGSYVKVTNLENGRALILLINDRGPFVRGRIIDLSKRAAELLGVIKKGTAKVIVERTDRSGRPLVKRAPVRQAKATPPPVRSAQPVPVVVQPIPQPQPLQPTPVLPEIPGPVIVQVGSFSDFYNARRLQQGLAAVGPTSITQVTSAAGQVLYRVQVGPYADLLAAEQALADIHAKGHTAATLHGVKAFQTSSR
jgi:rare lipoprotein A